MTIVKDLEIILPLLKTLPSDWQKDIALILSRILIAYDSTLTKSPVEQEVERDREFADFRRRYNLDHGSGRDDGR